MGVKVGSIDAIDPAGDKMKVTFHYDSKFKVPANATASILNPSLVASRDIQLSPPCTGGPVMASRRRCGGLIIETIDRVVQERSMGNRSRLRPPSPSGWRDSNPQPRRLERGRASPVVRRRAPCPALWPPGARLLKHVRRS